MEQLSSKPLVPTDPCPCCGQMTSKTEIYCYGMCLGCDELRFEQREEEIKELRDLKLSRDRIWE